jgi:hypothetical protein
VTLSIDDPDTGETFVLERDLLDILMVDQVRDLQAAVDANEKVTGEHALWCSARIIVEDQVEEAEARLERYVGKCFSKAMDKAVENGASRNIGEARVRSFIPEIGEEHALRYQILNGRVRSLKKKLRLAKMVENLLQQRLISLGSVSKALGNQMI